MKKICILSLMVLLMTGCQGLQNFSLSNMFNFGNKTASEDTLYEDNQQNNTNNSRDYSYEANNNSASHSSVVGESAASSQNIASQQAPKNPAQRVHAAIDRGNQQGAVRGEDGIADRTLFTCTAEEKKIFDKLKVFAIGHIALCNKNITPCRAKPQLEHVNTGSSTEVVLTFIEFDDSQIDLQLIRANGNQFPYIAKFTYTEMHFRARGKSREDALANGYKMYASRKLTELPRYMKNNWVQ